jgi:PHP domain
MQDLIQGTFHFHSTYSHDGRSTLGEIVSLLRGRGFSFCVMTDHFEDFDAAKFGRYVREIEESNQAGDFLLIPGIEVDLSGLHTIFFPVREYAEIARIVSEGTDRQGRMFKVLAHPTKYRFDLVEKHLEQYAIQGVELWNQQADGSHIPPLAFLEKMKLLPPRDDRHYFFGCDIHKATLKVNHVLSMRRPAEWTPEAIADTLIRGDFTSESLPTGIEFRNGTDQTEFASWLRALAEKPYSRGKFLRGVRRCLKPIYSALPREIRHSLNDVKNTMRNKM